MNYYFSFSLGKHVSYIVVVIHAAGDLQQGLRPAVESDKDNVIDSIKKSNV
jgi:hypothetical protein